MTVYSGAPSRSHELVALGAQAVKLLLAPIGGVLTLVPHKIPLLTSGRPPRFLMRGLELADTEFHGMRLWTFTPRRPTGKLVVAIHGGSYVGEATIFHWWTYSDMARRTGATVAALAYTLAPAGTAGTEVPRIADYLTRAIDERAAGDISVLGDSAGGGLALLAVQELIRRGAPTPGHLVLLAPWLDVSMSDARSGTVADPLLDVPNNIKYGKSWAGELDTRNPLASPLFGPLKGLPPTVVYSSSRDLLTIDALRLHDRVLAERVANVTFRWRRGLLHDWPIFPLPDARAERPNIYHDLAI